MHFIIETSLNIDQDDLTVMSMADSDLTKTSLPYFKAHSDTNDDLERWSARFSATGDADFYMERSGTPPPSFQLAPTLRLFHTQVPTPLVPR